MTPTPNPESVRRHAYELLERDAKLSPPECRLYEDEIRRLIDEKRAFTAYNVSRAVNGVLIQSGRVGLGHTVTRDAVHALVSIYRDDAGYKSLIVDLGERTRPWLYYPDEAARLSWLAEYLAKQQDRLLVGRQGRGRPRSKEFDKFTLERYSLLHNLADVAEEAANRFGGTADAARRRILRSHWYKALTPVARPPKQEPAAPAQPAAGSTQPSLVEAIKKHIRSRGPAKPKDIAFALEVDLRKIERTLERDPTRFQYQLGGTWRVI